MVSASQFVPQGAGGLIRITTQVGSEQAKDGGESDEGASGADRSGRHGQGFARGQWQFLYSDKRIVDIPGFTLPDLNTLFLRLKHFVAGPDVEGLVEGIEVSDGTVRPIERR
jgi:hypothetical protein